MTRHLDALIRAMSDPAFYPHRPDNVSVIQTHISVVFIAGDLVYKIKKPMNLGFLDFSTQEKRRYFCNQEVILNSRFSEGIYLGVVPLFRGLHGINLEGQGDEVDAAVVMRRIPEERLLKTMLAKDQVTQEMLDRVAARISFFHSQAATGPAIASFGSTEVIHQNIKENFDQALPFVGRTIEEETLRSISALAEGFLDRHRHLIKERINNGFIRDCHGDLHLDHVVILNGIMLFDCIEFNDRFRYSDTASDLGFLLMDLDFTGYPAFAGRIAQTYEEASGDRQVLLLLGFYKSYRAFVRGKVISFALDETEISDSEKASAVETARTYFQLSLACLKPPPPPAMIVTCGLTGSGKSFLAARLAKRLGAQVISSDIVRKEILGIKPDEHRLDKYREGIYTATATELTYEALLARAEEKLAKGESVILDASFTLFRYRAAARRVAGRLNASLRLVECIAPDRVVRERLAERIKRTNQPSDGRWEIYPRQKAESEPIREEEIDYLRVWDATTDIDPFLTSLVRELVCS